MDIERIIGLGNECVYAYYFPSQVTEGSFPHKIGKTKRNPILRIIQQQASMQEEPVIGSLIWCDDCFSVEALLHLYFEDRKLPTFGDEWYNLHPDAIMNVYQDGLPMLAWNKQLRYYRLRNGMTQTDLAEAADLRQGTISSVENGVAGTNIATIIEMCRELKLRMTFIPTE